MKPKPLPLSISPRHPAEALEANAPELLDVIRHDTPTGTRDLNTIRPHPNPTRTLEPRHVVDLARSIGVLGLIHPLVIDAEDVVIAGSHRYAALRILQSPPEDRAPLLAALCPRGPAKTLDDLAPPLLLLAYDHAALNLHAVPVRVLPLIQRTDPDAAWRAEVAENERRRDYSAADVRALAERLKSQGYRFGMGRPANGEQPGLPILAAVIGRHERNIRRLLSGESHIPDKSRADIRQSRLDEATKRLAAVAKAEAQRLTDADHRALRRVMDLLERLRDE